MIDITPLLKAALAEDIGTGDVTSLATIPADAQARFAMHARQDMVAAGLAFLPELFAMIDPAVRVVLKVKDGAAVEKGATLATLEGPARALLAGERTALNLVQQLSGVASLTAQYVAAVAGTSAQILDTRKTIPGLRAAQKYAVRCGGGVNHRMGLYDALLIKDNHIAVAGGVTAAVTAAKAYTANHLSADGEAGSPSPPAGEATRLSFLSMHPTCMDKKVSRSGEGASSEADTHYAPPSNPPPEGGRASRVAHSAILIEVECDTLAQLDEALAAGCDIVLLDNMDNATLAEGVKRAHAKGAKAEASGNVSLETVRRVAETGVDYISVGKLTHSAVAVDIGLDEVV